MRSVRDHLCLKPAREVIEFPIEGLVDTGGWDLKKALVLGLGGNAVVNEWARSPICYEEIDGFRAELTELLGVITDPRDTANHYRGLAQRQLSDLGDLTQAVKLKKVFYVLRPLLNLCWMEAKNFAKLPPMDVASLRGGISLTPALSDELDALLEKKAVTRELGFETLPASFVEALRDMMARYETIDLPKREGREERQRAAEEFYRRWVFRFDQLAEPDSP